jgi:hypothetical protein
MMHTMVARQREPHIVDKQNEFLSRFRNCDPEYVNCPIELFGPFIVDNLQP